ncbi:Sodium channel protein para [Echinococcus granulosus]|uniref:Sodium channel protein n=2 Tax=Echinococcus granulosus TaxID=6210 RepID=W6USA2_ECHGR|nr:Sodium channel protein para [Echinococcus granulosus]EUB64148.1 Sodium channel protein para [Echinococcus granulosus]
MDANFNGIDMQPTEECPNPLPQGFVLPQFIPLTPESVRLSLQRYQRQKRREQKAKELQKEQKRKRKEWRKNKANYDSDKSDPESASFVRPALNPVEEGLLDSTSEEEEEKDLPEVPSRANPMLATGKKLIPPLAKKFCAKRYTGKPLQEMDDFYRYKRSFVVISSDRTIHRLSLSPALFIFGPFSSIRRVAIYIMVHPYPFQMVTFTVFYTCEAIIRVVGCGLIRNEFAYLRDAWNWLDFIVITLAYLMFVVPFLGNLSALRSLRVLRALKTVTAVPGLKTIIGALMDAVMHLRDVAVLTLFMLSIFALIGVQLYRGTLLRKCVVPWPGFNTTVGGALLSQIATDVYYNKSFDPYLTTEIKSIFNGTFLINWMSPHMVCRNLTEDGNSTCPMDFICKQTRTGNPNFGYTNFDNFESALLCSFRLITQDYWESLYQLVLRANGPTHVFFFGMVIFLGSFYLLNIILAIVSMSYEQVCKQDMESDAQLAAAIELCAEDGDQEAKDSGEPEKGLPMVNGCGFHFPSALRRHSIATTDVYAQLTLLRRWKSDDVLFNHRKRDSPRIWDNAVLFVDELSMESVSHCKELISLTSLSKKNCVSLVSAELSTVSGASCLSRQTNPNGLSNGNPNALEMDPEQGRLPFNVPHFALPLKEKSVYRNHTNYSSSRFKRCAKDKSDMPSHNKSDKSHQNLKKCLCSCLFGQRRELLEHPECCKELSLPARICQYITTQIEPVLCGWTCCPCYDIFRRYIGYIILDPFVELFITICIVLNTLFMAIDQPEKGETLAAVLRIANYASLQDYKEYFADSWNIFDFAIVVFSLVEIPLTTIRGLSILRAFRLLRVFKLAKSWQTMKLLFSIVAMTLNALGNLTAVLMISIFVFAVLGMSLFGESYHQFTNVTRFPERCGKIPRWNFCDFTHSFMIVFRVLCGEWIESMWDCLEVNGWSCTIFFLMTMVLGNLVVLSLFLALLLSSFSAESFQKEEEAGDHNKLQAAFDRIYRFAVWMKLNIQKVFTPRRRRCCCRSGSKNMNHIEYGTQLNHLKSAASKDIEEIDVVLQNPITLQDSLAALIPESTPTTPFFSSPGTPDRKTSSFPMDIQEIDATDGKTEEADDVEEILEAESVDMAFWEHPEDCCAPWIWNQIGPLFKSCLDSKMGSVWRRLRQVCYYIVENRYFESFIFIMIIISSGTLALEDKNLPSRPRLKMALDYMDKLFTFIFLMEIILKWFAYGLRKFFSDAWCWLDFTIVTANKEEQGFRKWLDALSYKAYFRIAVTSMILSYGKEDGKSSMNSFKAMRTLRALRPLRALSRWEGMRIVVNALLQAIPSICNVVLVCFVFWLICSIMGMQLFGGKFRKCVSEATGERLPADQYPNRTVCELHKKLYKNVSWDNSKINFDNVPNGFLALLQVATFKGWIEIMSDAVDITDYDQQPVYNNATSYYLFFVLFIIVGSFFTLNLFIGVIIQNFNMQKKKVGGSLELFMTEDQKKYYHAMKKMVRRTPQKPIPKPKFWMSKWIFKVISNRNFDLFILGMIGLNTLIMCFEHHHQPEWMKQTMEIVNKMFIIIFTCEFILKLIGQRWYYFKDPWNIFDCCIVIFSLVCWGLEDLMTTLPVPPTTIRIVRLFRVGRVLRLVKSARGIRTLLFALIVSLPALFNVALLLFLTAFVYSIVGMSFFGKVAYYAGIDAEFNFETFPQAFIILLQISTSAGWSSVFEGLSNTDPAYCSQEEGTCGSFLWATLFLVSYLVISFMVIINMYIAVILENFSQATEDVQQGLTQDEFDAFYEVWELYDVHALGFIELQHLEEFVERIGPPLGIPRPNRIRLACLSVQICSQDRIFCMDLLDALTRNFLGRLTTEHPETLVEQVEVGSSQNQDGTIDRINFVAKAAKEPAVPISNTYERQRERMAAYKILYFWRSRRKSSESCVRVEETDS